MYTIIHLLLNVFFFFMTSFSIVPAEVGSLPVHVLDQKIVKCTSINNRFNQLPCNVPK